MDSVAILGDRMEADKETLHAIPPKPPVPLSSFIPQLNVPLGKQDQIIQAIWMPFTSSVSRVETQICIE